MQKGGPFKVVAVPVPVPKPDQILVLQKAIALNDLDRKQRDIGILIEEWPHVLGIEGAGVVEAVGSDVSNFRPGDEVLCLAGGEAHGEKWGGAYQERYVMPVSLVAKKPRNISIEEAASLP
jgi:NADPH:quinone reductase-like Zn-dependent oxidoreductase